MWAEPTEVTPDVTVNLEGLWLLQALLGIPQLAPELRVRPYGAARSDEWQVDHPGIELLREGGLVDDAGRVLEQFASRLFFERRGGDFTKPHLIVDRLRFRWE